MGPGHRTWNYRTCKTVGCGIRMWGGDELCEIDPKLPIRFERGWSEAP